MTSASPSKSTREHYTSGQKQANETSSNSQKHSIFEDIQAIVGGTLLIALALNLFAKCTLITGGAVGIALLTHYFTDWSIGLAIFLVNLPFYWLGYKKMGLAFIARTLTAVGALSIFTDQLPLWISFDKLNPLFAALLGGCLIGLGFIMVFRHGASLGGINILVLHWQDKYKINAGKTQMLIDGCILLTSGIIAPWDTVFYSLVGCVVVNALMIINFKASRYLGRSRS